MKTKEKLLALLECCRGKCVSGEFIARQLGVSRTAVWKAVKSLEKDGYKITAATKTGYRLSDENDILSAQGIEAFLHENAKILTYPSLDSTNIAAKQLAVAGEKHGTVVIADHQTAGRGRFGRSFFSPPGHGIYMSFILRPSEIWLTVPTLVTAFAAVAVCEAIESAAQKSPQIKWVNDVFLDGKKICGISNEAITDYESGGLQWIVTGIGVNFTTPKSGVPEELAQIVGSVFSDDMSDDIDSDDIDSKNPPITRNHLAAEIINRMAALDTDKKNCDEQSLLAKYKSRLMMLGEKITVTGSAGAPSTYEATALDIDETGRLLIQNNNGEILAISSGEVSVRRVN